jgi:uncharacterized membrane protein YagU involved in acid resistance
MNKFVAGALAGFAATIPMSWAMELMHQLLPHHERHPLPPRQITERVAKATGVNRHLSEEGRVWLSLAAHLGYGATVGTIYELVAPKVRRVPPLAKGTLFGVLVWAGSYLGILPAMGILKPATRHPARRNAVMIVAHLVWGSALAIFADALEQGSAGRHPGFLRRKLQGTFHPREAAHV